MGDASSTLSQNPDTSSEWFGRSKCFSLAIGSAGHDNGVAKARSTKGKKKYGKKYINDFTDDDEDDDDDGGWLDVTQDIEDFREYMNTKRHHTWLTHHGRVENLRQKTWGEYIVSGECGSKDDALRYLRDFFEETQTEDALALVYYTGHGEEGTGDWCFPDGNISYEEVRELIGEYNRHVRLYCDCCCSGHWVFQGQEDRIGVVSASGFGEALNREFALAMFHDDDDAWDVLLETEALVTDPCTDPFGNSLSTKQPVLMFRPREKDIQAVSADQMK